MKRRIRAVIFDMDGLMFDTERLSAMMWKRAGREMGIDVSDAFIGQIRGTNRRGTEECFRRCYGDACDAAGIRERRGRYVREYLEKHGVTVKPGLYELLAYLKENGYGIVLATSTRREQAMANLESAGVRRYFDGCVCGDMVERGKPDPEIFLKAAEIAGHEPAECVVLEDSFNGVRAAAAGGFPAVMVPDMDPPTAEILEKTEACCQSLRQVIPFLEQREKNRAE